MAPLKAAFSKPSYLIDEEHPISISPPLAHEREPTGEVERGNRQSPPAPTFVQANHSSMDERSTVSEPIPGTSQQLATATGLTNCVQRGFCVHNTSLLNCLTCFRRVKREFYSRWPNTTAERFFDNLSDFYDAAVTVFGQHVRILPQGLVSQSLPNIPSTSCGNSTGQSLCISTTAEPLASTSGEPTSYPGTSNAFLPPMSPYDDISDDELVIDEDVVDLPPPASPPLVLPAFNPNDDVWDDILALVANDPIMNRDHNPIDTQEVSTQTDDSHLHEE